MSDTEKKDPSGLTAPPAPGSSNITSAFWGPAQGSTNMTAAKRGPKFDYFLASDVDHYEQFKDRVELFVALNPEAEKIKAMIFLNAISMELYSLIDSLCRPSKPANKTLQEIFKILDGHYKKTTNKRAERVNSTDWYKTRRINSRIRRASQGGGPNMCIWRRSARR